MTVAKGDSIAGSELYTKKIKASDGKEVSLDQFKGQKAVVLFFFPKAATPGCTKEACKFRDEYSVFKEAGAEVLGISGDTPESNAAFAKAQRLPFPLLSDEGNAFRKTLGVKGNLLGLIPGRQTFVFDKEGVCALVFNSQMQPEKHITEALAVIKTL